MSDSEDGAAGATPDDRADGDGREGRNDREGQEGHEDRTGSDGGDAESSTAESELDGGSEQDPDGGPASDGESEGSESDVDPAATLVLAAFDGPEPLTTAEVAAAVDEAPAWATSALESVADAGHLGEKVVESTRLWYPTPGNDDRSTASDGTDPAHRATTADPADDRGGHGDAGGADADTDQNPDPDPHPGDTEDGASADEGGEASADEGDGAWALDEVTVRGEGFAVDPGGVDDAVAAAVEELSVPGTSEMMRDWRRSAVEAAFEFVRAEGATRSEVIVEAVYAGNRAGFDDEDAWWACVAPRLAELPGIDRAGERWEFVGLD